MAPGRDCCGDRITATPAVTSHEGSQIPRDRLIMAISSTYFFVNRTNAMEF